MNVNLKTPLLDAIRAGQGLGGMGALGAGSKVQAGQGAGEVNGGQFANALRDALNQVSRTQDESSKMQRAYQLGEAGVGLEQTMIAMQKSQVAFQAALTVRNRLVSAYTDIMNMQV